MVGLIEIPTTSREQNRGRTCRAPKSRDRWSRPISGRRGASITRTGSLHPLQYINGANTYQFVGSDPVGMVDAGGTKVFTWRVSRAFDPYSVGFILAPPVLHLNYSYRFRYYDVGGQPGVSNLVNIAYSPAALGASVDSVSLSGGYHLDLGTKTFPDPKEHALLLVVKGVYRYYWSGQVGVGAKGVSLPGPRVSTPPTTVLVFEDDFLIFDDCGRVHVAPITLPFSF